MTKRATVTPCDALLDNKTMRIDRFVSRFGRAGNSGEGKSSLSKGELLRQLETMINEAHQKVKAFEEGRTDYIGYVLKFRNRVQHCLLDIGQCAKDELYQLASMDFSISDGLQQYYDAEIFNDFEVKNGDPSDFLRLQKEYDQAMPSKIRRMITLMEQVRDKMLGLSRIAVAPELLARRNQKPDAECQTRGKPQREARSQYSATDKERFERIGGDLMRTLTNAELWKRFRREERRSRPNITCQAFRQSLNRIRKYHDFPSSRNLQKSDQIS